MPATDTCRWCHGTGWAAVQDSLLGDSYPVRCPGDCPDCEAECGRPCHWWCARYEEPVYDDEEASDAAL